MTNTIARIAGESQYSAATQEIWPAGTLRADVRALMDFTEDLFYQAASDPNIDPSKLASLLAELVAK